MAMKQVTETELIKCITLSQNHIGELYHGLHYDRQGTLIIDNASREINTDFFKKNSKGDYVYLKQSYTITSRLKLDYYWQEIKGAMGYSELGIHTRNAEKNAFVALVNPAGTYAYIWFDDGLMCDGCFRLFNDRSFSLS